MAKDRLVKGSEDAGSAAIQDTFDLELGKKQAALDAEAQREASDAFAKGVPVKAPLSYPEASASMPKPSASQPLPPPMYRPPESTNFIGRLLKAGAYAHSAINHQVPFDIKLQQAQQESVRKQIEIQQGWMNFQKSKEEIRGLMQLHEQRRTAAFMNMWPTIVADVINFPRGSEQRAARVDSYKRIAGGLHEEAGALLDKLRDDAIGILEANYILRNSPGYREQLETGARTLDQIYADPLFKPMMRARGFDTVRAMLMRAIKDSNFHDSYMKGEVSYNDFIEKVVETAQDPDYGDKVEQETVQFFKEFVQTPEGEEILIGLDIIPPSLARKRKEFEFTNPKQAAINTEIRTLQAKVDAGIATTREKERLDRYYGQRSRLSDTQARAGRLAAFIAKHAAEFGDYQSIPQLQDALTRGEITLEQYTQVINNATRDEALAGPQAKQDVDLGAPADQTKGATYLPSDIAIGRMVPTKGTKRDLMEGRIIRLEPKDMERIAQLKEARFQGGQQFVRGAKVFQAFEAWDIAKQKLMFETMRKTGNIIKAFAAVGPQYGADMQAYISTAQAWASSFARAFGGEKGVMTNEDIERWERIFPTATDDIYAISEKIKLFNELSDYLINVQLTMLSREFSVVTADGKDYVDSVDEDYLAYRRQLDEFTKQRDAILASRKEADAEQFAADAKKQRQATAGKNLRKKLKKKD